MPSYTLRLLPLLFVLAACAPMPPATSDGTPDGTAIESIGKEMSAASAPEAAAPPPPAVSTPPVAGCPEGACAQVPRQRNLTSQPTLLLAGDDSAGAYWSFGLKSSYSFDEHGQLTPLTGEAAEPMIGLDTPAEGAEECHIWGSAYNQRTTWFPDTAIFVAGGKLTQVRHGTTARAAPRRALVATGKGARTVTVRKNPKPKEYWRVPCVGRQRVKGGWRTDTLLVGGDRLTVRPAKGKELNLRIPDAAAPYMLLAYSDSGRPAAGAIAAVPMHVVLVTVDVPRRRLVLQWQATAARSPTVYDAAWALTVPEGEHSALPPARRAFASHVAVHLARCPPPKTPMNECASPDRALRPEVIDALMR